MRNGGMKKKRIIIIVVIVLLIILTFPVKLSYKDGGTVEYKAILYSITLHHSMWENTKEWFEFYRSDIEEGVHGNLTGTTIEIFGRTVYENIKFVTRDECKCKRCNT